MSRPVNNPWLNRFAVLTAVATFVLIGIGGLVTSKGVGMAVPDWPNTYGYNMFFFPVSQWVGGIFYEHTHRLVATVVGTLVVCLTRWLGGAPARRPLAIIGILGGNGGNHFAAPDCQSSAVPDIFFQESAVWSCSPPWFGRATSPPYARSASWAGLCFSRFNYRVCSAVCA